jgi:hypothetical protein
MKTENKYFVEKKLGCGCGCDGSNKKKKVDSCQANRIKRDDRAECLRKKSVHKIGKIIIF